jgi:hypothetical protein
MEAYKQIKDILDDDEAMRHHFSTVGLHDVVKLVQFLAGRHRAREASVKRYQAKKIQELGVTPYWDYLKNNPEAYQKRLEYSRQYMRTKREQTRSKHS